MTDSREQGRATFAALVEVGAVLILFVLVGRWLRATGFSAWQESVLGSRAASNTLLFVGLPTLALAFSRKSLASCGLSARPMGYHLRIGGTVGGLLLPATMLFPVIMMRQWSPMELTGASVLTLGFGLAGLLALAIVSKQPNNRALEPSSRTGSLFVGVLVLGLVASFLLSRVSMLGPRLLYVFLFVAFLEEFFFRGYIQGRLNEVFERPWSLLGTTFGPGLVASTLLFGLFHPVMSPDGFPWPWALWTGAVGCVFGLIREKTGSIAASSIAHAMILTPQVLFAP